MTAVRYPRLLDAALAEKDRLRPTAFSLTEQLRETSTAQMTVVGGYVAMHDWLELYTVEGSVGLYRVTGIDTTPLQEDALTLRHGIDTLADEVWADQLDYDGTVDDYLTDLLAQQATVRWQLGACADTGAYKRSGINYTRLSELFWALFDDRLGYYPTFDFTTTPWTINVVALPQTVAAEFRLARNIEDVTIRRIDSDMCNRLYLSVSTAGTPTLRTYNNTASQALYGVITKTADINTEDVPDPDAWAAEFLARRASPTVQITVNGYALNQLTGQAYDTITVGKKCRVVLQAIPEALDETIVSKTWDNVIDEPLRVAVELNNRLDKFSEAVANLKRTVARVGGVAGGAWRASTANSAEITHWAQIVTEHSDILDDTGLQELYQSGIVMDAQTGVTIYNLAQGFQSNYAGIQVNNRAITTEVSTARSAESALSSRITQNANSIALVVENGAIKPASIVAAINDSASTVKISADHIVLDGATVAASLASQNVTASSLTGSYITANGSLTLASGGSLSLWGDNWANRTLKAGDAAGLPSAAVVSIGTGDISLEHYHNISVSESNGVVTITQGAVSVTAGSDSFNIANTQYYQSGVAAAKRAGWSEAAASIVWPQAGTGSSIAITYPDQTYGDLLTAHYGMTQTSWNNKTKYVNLYGDDTSMGAVARVSVDASGVYDDGWDAAAAVVSVPTAEHLGSSMSVSYPTTGGGTGSTQYALDTGSWSGGYNPPRRYISLETGSTTVARTYVAATVGTASATWAGTAPSGTASVTVRVTICGRQYTWSFNN